MPLLTFFLFIPDLASIVVSSGGVPKKWNYIDVTQHDIWRLKTLKNIGKNYKNNSMVNSIR